MEDTMTVDEVKPAVVAEAIVPTPLALDVNLERVRALHRVWRALNDGDCPKCHRYRAATEMRRDFRENVEGIHRYMIGSPGTIQCPDCGFCVTRQEIEAIEELFAPAMDAAVKIFEEWQHERVIGQRLKERIEMDVFLGIVPGERWPR